MAASTWLDEKLAEMETCKSAVGCCNSWIEEAGRQLEQFRKPLGIIVLGQIIGRQSRHAVFKPATINLETPEERQLEIAKHVLGFLNTNEGGCMYFGVNEFGEVMGLMPKEETKLKDDVDAVIKSIGSTDHNFHHAIHFFRLHRYHMRSKNPPPYYDGTTTPGGSRVPEPLLPEDKLTPHHTELLLAALSISRCKVFPKLPYTSSMQKDETYVRRDGSTSPISREYYKNEETWMTAHASHCYNEKREEQSQHFDDLARLKNVIFNLSEKLVEYEHQIDTD